MVGAWVGALVTLGVVVVAGSLFVVVWASVGILVGFAAVGMLKLDEALEDGSAGVVVAGLAVGTLLCLRQLGHL